MSTELSNYNVCAIAALTSIIHDEGFDHHHHHYMKFIRHPDHSLDQITSWFYDDVMNLGWYGLSDDFLAIDQGQLKIDVLEERRRREKGGFKYHLKKGRDEVAFRLLYGVNWRNQASRKFEKLALKIKELERVEDEWRELIEEELPEIINSITKPLSSLAVPFARCSSRWPSVRNSFKSTSSSELTSGNIPGDGKFVVLGVNLYTSDGGVLLDEKGLKNLLDSQHVLSDTLTLPLGAKLTMLDISDSTPSMNLYTRSNFLNAQDIKLVAGVTRGEHSLIVHKTKFTRSNNFGALYQSKKLSLGLKLRILDPTYDFDYNSFLLGSVTLRLNNIVEGNIMSNKGVAIESSYHFTLSSTEDKLTLVATKRRASKKPRVSDESGKSVESGSCSNSSDQTTASEGTLSNTTVTSVGSTSSTEHLEREQECSEEVREL